MPGPSMKTGMLQQIVLPLILSLCVVLSGCGGGGGGGSSEPTPSGSSSSSSSSSGGSSSSSSGGSSGGSSSSGGGTGTAIDGIFLDSPVVGLSYSTATGLSGVTDDSGTFQFQADDAISFSLGSIQFPEVDALPVMTPFDLFQIKDFSSDALVNTLVLLQTLDDDGDIEQNIVIPPSSVQAVASAGLEYADLAQPYSEFVTSEKFKALASNLTAKQGVVSRISAIRHFSRQLAESELIDSDDDGLVNRADPDDDNDGVADELDFLPWNPQEQRDFDGDYLGDIADNDDDEDALEDGIDNHLELVDIVGSGLEGAADSYVDTARNLVYISYKASKRVDVLDLRSGELLQNFAFAHAPERMTASPDGSKLYIALLEQEHSYYWWDEDQLGYIAIVDLDSRQIVKTLTITIDPYDLVVTSSGKLIVTSGSGQWTSLIAYDADTGVELGRYQNIYQGSLLSLHPTEESLFVARPSSSDIEKFNISGPGITRIANSPYVGGYRSGYDVWATPDGKYVLAGAGDLFLASDLSYVKSVSPQSTTIQNVYFDTAQNLAWLVLSDRSVLVVNLTTFEAVTTDVIIGSLVGMASDADSIQYFLFDQSELLRVKKLHPCPDCGANTAPLAKYTYSPPSGDTTHTYTFDASLSTDAESGSALKYRWDIDNDGQWESDFSTIATMQHRFTIAGSRIVRLQVKDEGGLVASTVKSVSVAQGIDSGVVVDDSVAYTLDFGITDVLQDEARGRLYISDKAGKRLYVVNAATGLTERYFEFDFMPERMTMTTDGSKMYLALLAQEHSYYWWEEDQYGYIAEFDLEQSAHVKTLKVATDPYDLVITDTGKLIISSGSGQWTDIFAYDAVTGEVLGKSGIRQASRLTLHPSQNWVFAADTELSPSDIEKFDISGVGIVSVGDSPYHGDHRMSGNVWATPDGKYLVTRGGDIFNAADMTYVASLTGQGVYIEQIAFDSSENVAFALTTGGKIQYFNMTSWLQIGSVPATEGTAWISVAGGSLVSLVDTGPEFQMLESSHPCSGCGDNTAPLASFSYGPEPGDTSDSYSFDASASTDTEDGSDVRYRWDINGDGEWDSDFTTSAIVVHKYLLAGSYQVRLQVRDSGGLTATSTQLISVAQGIDGGTEITDSVAYLLDFTATEMEIDLPRSRAYISDKSAKRLYIVNLQTGLTERYFEFSAFPERMTITPDGSKLYLSLLSRESSTYRSISEQYGYVAEFDLEQQAHVNTLRVSIDAYDLAATDNGKLIVSGQQGYMHAYDVSSGSLVESVYISDDARLALHPSQNWVFAVQSGSSSTIYKFDIAGSGFGDGSTSAYSGSYRVNGNIWVSPDGNYLITRGGDIFRTSDLAFVSGLAVQNVYIEQLAFDPLENVAFALLSDGTASYFNMTSWLQIDSMPVAADTQFISVVGSSIFTVAETGVYYQLTETVHPCIGCGANLAPVASLSYGPDSGDTTDIFSFDASASIDDEDGTALQYRWDLDGDGEWDGGFASTASMNHRYFIAGTYNVRVQVRDSGGLTAIAQQSITVAQGMDSGSEVTGGTAYQLDFSVTDFAVDTIRDKAYFTDKAAKRLYVVNLLTGLTERYFEFGYMPERMAITPDGSKLYLALLVQDHSSYWWEEEQYGYVATFDLTQQAHVDTMLVATDPYDLVATDSGKLVVASGSGQWTEIHAYDTETKSLLGKSGIRQRSRIALHPSQNWVFAADTDISPSDIEKFDISGVAITSIGDSPYHGDHRMYGNVWATPDSQHVITRGGDVFLASDMTYVLSLTSTGVNIQSLAFEDGAGVVHLLGSDGTLYTYDYLTSFEYLGSSTSIVNAQHVLQSGDRLFVISQGTGSLTLQEQVK